MSLYKLAEPRKKIKYENYRLYGICRQVGYCVEDCGLCAYIEPVQEPSYKATNQAYNYQHKKAKGLLLEPDTKGIQIGYKEPFRPVEDGYGYYGTLTVDESETFVQCHVCGFFFKWLPSHLREHGLTGREYKDKYGLMLKTTLLTESANKEWSQKRMYNYTPGHRKQAQYAVALATASRTSGDSAGKSGKLALEYYNKFGLCPDQVIDKYLTLKQKLGKDPTFKQIAREYTYGVPKLLMRVFGSWNDVKRELS